MKATKTKVRAKASPEPPATSRSGTRIGKANCEQGSRYLTCGAIRPSCSATRHRLKPTVVSITSARSRSRRRSSWPGRITLRPQTRLLADSRERICGVIDETRASSSMYANRWDVHGCVCVYLTPETGVRKPYGAPNSFKRPLMLIEYPCLLLGAGRTSSSGSSGSVNDPKRTFRGWGIGWLASRGKRERRDR